MKAQFQAVSDDYRRPSACKADALPTELIVHVGKYSFVMTSTGFEPVNVSVKG